MKKILVFLIFCVKLKFFQLAGLVFVQNLINLLNLKINFHFYTLSYWYYRYYTYKICYDSFSRACICRRVNDKNTLLS